MNITRQKELARDFGYNRIGIQEALYDVPLTDTDKVNAGKSISDSIVAINSLNDELKEIKADFKAKIEAHRKVVQEGSYMLKTGKKQMKRNLPCFFDPRKNERIFIDDETAEIVAVTSARLGDDQVNLIDE